MFETYYSARVLPWLFATFDMQHVSNPAFNKDRGPLWIPSIRLHIAFRADTALRLQIIVYEFG